MERVLRDEVLALLKAREGKPLSGEEMSRALGVSRAAVWSYVSGLLDLRLGKEECAVITSRERIELKEEGSTRS